MNLKIFDCAILVLVALFFVGLISFEYYILGLQHPIVQISLEWKPFFDVLIYPLVVLLTVDLALKYRKEKNSKKFLRKYWMDIAMLALIPILSVFKFLKIGLSLAKQFKAIKMGAKAAHKTKKISKK